MVRCSKDTLELLIHRLGTQEKLRDVLGHLLRRGERAPRMILELLYQLADLLGGVAGLLGDY